MPAKFFDTRPKFRLVDQPSAMVCSLLNAGLHQGIGSVGIHASKAGLRITICGHTVARGKTPAELEEAYNTARAKAITATKQ